jgi:hypothetical protein
MLIIYWAARMALKVAQFAAKKWLYEGATTFSRMATSRISLGRMKFVILT